MQRRTSRSMTERLVLDGFDGQCTPEVVPQLPQFPQPFPTWFSEELYHFRISWLSYLGERLSCELGGAIQIFGDFGGILTNNIRERYIQDPNYQHHNAGIKNRATMFNAHWLGDSKSATIIKINLVFNIETCTRKYTYYALQIPKVLYNSNYLLKSILTWYIAPRAFVHLILT